jgi:toxin YoeB
LAVDSGDNVPFIDSGYADIYPQGPQNTIVQVLENGKVVSWTLYYTRQAQKDAKKVSSANLRDKVEVLLAVLEKNPFQTPPPFEKLKGDLAGAYSRRINIQHRLVYQVIKEQRAVKILRMWTHYE